MTLRIGVVTIGETPRDDVLSDIRSLIGVDVETVERGVLDDLTATEKARLAPQNNEEILVTRMRDGAEVMLSKNRILPRLQERIAELDRQENMSMITLLCSGRFPPFRCATPLIMPYQLLIGIVRSITIAGRLGMMVPSAAQVEGMVAESVESANGDILAVSASPFAGEDGIARAAEKLRGKVGAVFMNCFGYTLRMKSIVREVTGTPVILPRSLLARILEDLIHG